MSIHNQKNQQTRSVRREPVATGVADGMRTSLVTHRDQYVHYTHELPEATAEAASRALIRLVPLAYGILLGGLLDQVTLGLVGGVMVGAAIDLRMADHSLVRAAAGGLHRFGCAAVAAVAHGLAGALQRLGRVPPGVL